MAEPYLSQLQEIIAECGPDEALGDLVCRHFFSGAAAHYIGAIVMTLSPVGLALKLPERDRTVLMDAGGRPLRYFPKAPIKKDYVVVPDDLMGDLPGLKTWIAQSLTGL